VHTETPTTEHLDSAADSWQARQISVRTLRFGSRQLGGPASMNLISHTEQNSQVHKEIGPRTSRRISDPQMAPCALTNGAFRGLFRDLTYII
jgi:hypothetical protein